MSSANVIFSGGAYRHPVETMMEESAEALRTLEADERFAGCKVAGFFSVPYPIGRVVNPAAS